MNFRKTLVSAAFAVAVTQANAENPAPAWQEPGFVMGEIIVSLPRAERDRTEALEEVVVTLARAEQDALRIAGEIIVTLSLEEQAVIRAAYLEGGDAFELAVKPARQAIRL